MGSRASIMAGARRYRERDLEWPPPRPSTQWASATSLDAVALLLDGAHWPWRGRLWCHLVSDTSLHELHAFAEWIGVPRRAFQGDHYDIPEEARPVAIEEGAIVVTSREIVLALYACGIRRRPAERVRTRDSA